MADNFQDIKASDPSAGENRQKTVQTATLDINRDAKEEFTAKKALKLGMAYIDIAKQAINTDVFTLIDYETAKAAIILPFYKIGKKVAIAIAHPTKKESLDLINSLKTQGYKINYNLATEEGVLETIEKYRKDMLEKPVSDSMETKEIKPFKEEIEDLHSLGTKMEELTSKEALDLLNLAAIKTAASDIHIQPEEKIAKIRFRIDGLLQSITTLSSQVYTELSNQLKYQAKLKLNINNVPQDGRYSFIVDNRKIDVRVSAMPTEFGETFVCRLLDSSKGLVPLNELGFTDLNWQELQAAVKITEGLILLTGPTGSGKTTTLYSMLNSFNRPEIKIITMEDPIEYHIEDISQSQINEKRGYTYASGIKAVLRQDPDVVMIGEIRDLDTATVAMQAALTGHTVLSTLHTNSAVDSIPRLLNMGLQPFMVAPSSYIYIAQRLMRKICPSCSTKRPLSATEKDYLERKIASIKSVDKNYNPPALTEILFGKGCKECSNTGYKGRTCIVEVLKFTPEIKEKILNNASTTEIFECARKNGLLTLEEDGVKKILAGITTIEELHRVTTEKES